MVLFVSSFPVVRPIIVSEKKLQALFSDSGNLLKYNVLPLSRIITSFGLIYFNQNNIQSTGHVL